MLLKFVFVVLFFYIFCSNTVFVFAQMDSCANGVSKVWCADNGDGTYSNPILHADYSDPDVIRVGDDYFMTASSFNCSPAIPILHSKDMVSWQIVNFALNKLLPADVYNKPQHGKGVWAPCLRFHAGVYYIFWGDPDFGVFMVKAKDPFGSWDEPVLVLPGKGIIDPSPLWDDDGRVYMVTAWAASRAGINSVLTLWQLDETASHVIGDGVHVFDGHGKHHTVEGPKLYKKDGFYYIFAPAGGVATGWQLVLRSRNILGSYNEKIVLAQGSTNINGPHQGGWVETQTGESWFVHFQDKAAYGRILHLQPVNWLDGWPVIGYDSDGDGCGEPVLRYRKPNVGGVFPVVSPSESDEFENGILGKQWQWAANQDIRWFVHLPAQNYFRLMAFPKSTQNQQLWDTPNVLLQKFTAPSFSVITKLRFNVEFDVWQGKHAGLMVSGNDYAYLAITKDEKGYKLNLAVCFDADKGGKEKIVETVRLDTNEVLLKVSVSDNATYQFAFSVDGSNFIKVGKTLLAKPELWIGAKVGIFCTSEFNVPRGGYTDFDWFRVEK